MSNTVDSHIDLEQISSHADLLMNSISIDNRPAFNNSTDILNNYSLFNDTFPLLSSPITTSTIPTVSFKTQTFRTNNYTTNPFLPSSTRNSTTITSSDNNNNDNNNYNGSSLISLTPTSSATNMTYLSNFNNYSFSLQQLAFPNEIGTSNSINSCNTITPLKFASFFSPNSSSCSSEQNSYFRTPKCNYINVLPSFKHATQCIRPLNNNNNNNNSKKSLRNQKGLHKKTEKRYRININSRIAQLQQLIPSVASNTTAFEISDSMKKKMNGLDQPFSSSFSSSSPTTTSTFTPSKNNTPAKQKIHKSMILEKAVDYIIYLQNKQNIYEVEVQKLKRKLESYKK